MTKHVYDVHGNKKEKRDFHDDIVLWQNRFYLCMYNKTAELYFGGFVTTPNIGQPNKEAHTINTK